MDKSKYTIAYFSMEVGIRNSIPTYSGGLGMLAGDTLKSCADLEIPIIGITMLNLTGMKQIVGGDKLQEIALI